MSIIFYVQSSLYLQNVEYNFIEQFNTLVILLTDSKLKRKFGIYSKDRDSEDVALASLMLWTEKVELSTYVTKRKNI